MYEFLTKNTIVFTFSVLVGVLGSYPIDFRILEDYGVDFELMKQNKVRSVEITCSEFYNRKTIMTYLFNDKGLLVKYNTTEYDPKSNKLLRKYSYSYEFDDRGFMTKEECKDANDSIILNHIYKWSFLSTNVLEVRQVGYRHIFGDGSPDTNIAVPSNNSYTLTLDSDNHILNCLAITNTDTIYETYSYNNKEQVERVSLSDNMGGRSRSPYYSFKYNANGKIIEVIDVKDFKDTLNNKRIGDWTIREFDVQNRLVKTSRKTGIGLPWHETYFYEYDKHDKIISSTCEGSPCDYKREASDYYGNGLIKKRVRKTTFVDMRERKPYTPATETTYYKYE